MRVWLALLAVSFAGFVVCVITKVIAGRAGIGEIATDAMLSTSIAPIFCTIGVVAAVVMRRGALGGFMLASMACTAVSMVWWCIVIWGALDHPEPAPPLRWPTSILIVGLVLAIAGFQLTHPDRRPPLPRLRLVAAAASVLAAYGILLLLWSTVWHRYTLALVIATAAATLVAWGAFILIALARKYVAYRERHAVSLPTRVELEIECPRCRHEQALATGLARCARCGLAMQIDVEEPRCACGYVLYRLSGETCPECGREV